MPRAESHGSTKRMVVVAGHDDQLSAGESAAELGEEGPCQLQRLSDGAVAKLDHVAEQHDAVDVGNLSQERIDCLRSAQQVRLVNAAEVEVGEDQGAHRSGPSASGGPRPPAGHPPAAVLRMPRWR